MFPELYDSLAPPVQGQIFLRDASGTAARYETPPQWLPAKTGGALVSFMNASTVTLYVAFGGPGVKVAAASRAIVLGETIAPHWGSGMAIPAGKVQRIPIGAEDTHFSVVSGSGPAGEWCAWLSSGYPAYGENLDTNSIGTPVLWLDAGSRRALTLNSGAITVAAWRDRVTGYTFSEASTYPDWLDAGTVGSGMPRPDVQFVAGSSEKLVNTDATLAALLGGANALTLCIAAKRNAATALHTYFSVGTAGSNDGRWDFTINASEDPIVTRVTAAGVSTTSTNATTIASGDMDIWTVTFDGTNTGIYKDRTAYSLTGNATGSVGTTTKITIGARGYNTSTFDQYASAEISDVIVFSEALTGDRLDRLHAWLKRRYAQ